MFVDLVPKPRTLARAALTVAYLGLMLIMTIVAWQGGKVDLSSVGQVASGLAAALLGAVINPTGSKKAAPSAPTATTAPAVAAGGARETDVFWAVQAVVGSAALLLTALALAVSGSRHINAPEAFVAVAAAFGALFLDTSNVTHPLTDSSATGATAAPAAGVAGGPGGATGGDATTGQEETTKTQIPAQSIGSTDDAGSPNG
jgi:hypothetical protein